MRRFINADIIAGEISNAITLNRFAYANGNPVSSVDPFGLSAERNNSEQSDNDWYSDELSAAIHTILDIAGFIPGWGAIADALNALIYAIEGDWTNAGMSALSAIPGFGDIASGCKWATKLFKSSSKIYKALDSVATFATKIDDVIKSASKASDILYATSKSEDAVEFTVKQVKNSPNVLETAKNIYKNADPESILRNPYGSYEIKYKDGYNYIGKGGFERAMTSAKEHAGNLDNIKSINWKPAKSESDAFIDEYLRQKEFGGVLSSNKNLKTYNKIWSPGKKYYGD